MIVASLIAISIISNLLAIGFLLTGKYEAPLLRIHGAATGVTVDFIHIERAGENAAHLKDIIHDAVAEERRHGDQAHYKWKKVARHVEALPKNLGKNTAAVIHAHVNHLKPHNPYWADSNHPGR